MEKSRQELAQEAADQLHPPHEHYSFENVPLDLWDQTSDEGEVKDDFYWTYNLISLGPYWPYEPYACAAVQNW